MGIDDLIYRIGGVWWICLFFMFSRLDAEVPVSDSVYPVSVSDSILPLASDSAAHSAIINDSIAPPVFDSANLASVSDSSAPDSMLKQTGELTIIVTGKQPAGKDKTANPTVIKGNNVRETSRTTPLEELSQESADIYVSSKGAGLHGVANGASGGIYIRGLGGSPNSQVLVVEDGAPDYQGIFGHPIPDAFFPSLIDRVVVVKGGDGALYGTNAMGGVILVQNRWPDSAGTLLENDAAYGSFNTFRERVTLLAKGKQTDVASAFSAFSTDGHRDGTDGKSVAGQIGVRLQLPKSITIAFRDKVIRLEGGDPGPYFSPHTDHRFDVLRNNFSARINWYGSPINIQVVPWLNVGEHRLYDGFFSRDYTAGGTAECSSTLFDQRVDLLIGTAGEYVDGTVRDRIEGTEIPVNKSTSAGAYGQLTYSPGLGLAGVCGGRLHYSNKYGTIPLYKAGIKWDPLETISFHSRFTKNFRQPTIRELYLPFPVANPDLRPETAFNWDAGTEVKLGFMRLNGAVYKTWATDMIKYFGMWPSAEVVNIDKLEIWGIEGECHVAQFGPFSAFITGCWQDVGRYTKQNPDGKINAKLNYGSQLKAGHLECELTSEWVHGLYMNNYHRDPMKNVFFIDGSIRLKTKRANGVEFEPYCLIRNILNVPYEYIQFYPMPGINILAGITIKV